MNQATHTLMSQAKAATRSRHFSKAGRILDIAIKKDPTNLELRIEYALNRYALQDFVRSADAFHRLHLEYPIDHRIWQGCASSYMKLGEFNTAEQFLKKIVANNPKDFDAWLNLCNCAGASGKHSDTLFYAIQALQLRPEDPRAHNNLGCALMAVQKYHDAIISFETAIALDSKNLDPLSNIATIHSLTGNSQKALDLYECCLKISNKNSDFAESTRYRMSFDLLRLGRLREGWAAYEYGFKPIDT